MTQLELQRQISEGVQLMMDAWKNFNIEMGAFNAALDRVDYEEAEEHRLVASALLDAACDQSVLCRRLMAQL